MNIALYFAGWHGIFIAGLMQQQIGNILEQTAHRPFALPGKKWLLHQRWREVLFLHFPVKTLWISRLLGPQLKVDSFYGSAWVSLVIFDSCNNKLRFSGNIPMLPDFTECNLRTYVTYDNKPGVYFLDILGSRLINTSLISLLTRLEYKKARFVSNPSSRYRIGTAYQQQLIDVYYQPGEIIKDKTDFDKWITERYCCYKIKKAKIYRYDIHHLEWLLQSVKLEYSHIHYPFADRIIVSEDIRLCHYAKNTVALLWAGKKV